MSDRLVSFMAEGVDVLVSTDHSHVTDYGPLISSLGVSSEIATIIGEELTGGSPVPADATQGGIQAFPEGIGHWNAWPLQISPTNRRNGAPQNEFITPGTAIDRLRGMDSLALLGKTPDTASIEDWVTAIGIGEATGDQEVVMLNHPRAGFAGLVVIGMFNGLNNPGGSPPGGFDPDLPITSAPNNLLFTPSLYNEAVIGPGGTQTTALSFDALEVIGGYSPREIESNTLQVARYHEERTRGGPLPIVGASDSHGCRKGVLFGWYYTLVFAPSCELPDLIDGVKNLWSVAIEALPGESPRPHGPFRLVKYALFLLREVFPAHDELCSDEGQLMLDHVRGNAAASEELAQLSGRTAKLRDSFWAS